MSPSQEAPQEPPQQDEPSLQGRIHSIYRANPAGMGVVANRILVEVNDRLCRMTGYTAEELLGNDARLLYVSDEEYERVGRRGFAQAEDEGTTTTETLWRRKDGSVLDVLLGSSPIRLGAPEYGVTFTALDITGWKAAERTVQQNEKTLDALLNATTDLAVLVEPDGTLAAFNDAFARLLGGGSPRALSGASLWELEGLPLDARVRREAAEVARSGTPARVESLHGAQVYDVGIFPIPGPGGIPRIAYFIRDVTSVRQTEEQLRQSQKMEAVGRLAGGIAHDFNNLITVIRGFSELVLGELPGDSRLAEDVAQVKAAADRAAELTARLLTFSRKQVVAPRIVEPAALVRGLEGMLRRVIGEDIAFATDFAADTGRIMADAGQVEQVVMNLAVNARDAMPRGGRLTITAANQLVAERQEPDFPGLAPGEYVRLEISDTGHGMDRETLSRIFEPFFTTKEAGKGTGMGLSTVYGIVAQSGGRIYCTSNRGEGTTFTIFFPRLLGPAAEPARAEPHRRPAGGSERVLLVEDEDAVRGYVRRVLENGGYHVLEAGSGESALRIVESERGTIDLLLTDVVMPGMGGPELASRVAGLVPAVRTLYISGYGRPALERRGAFSSGAPLLGKPFDEVSLLSAVREVLSA